MAVLAGALLALALAALPAAADPVGPNGPVIAFMGHRYAVCRGGQAFESIAFDPVHQHVASRGKIRDLCGVEISNGPDEQPGLAWDPVTGLYWQITNDRTVRRWNGATLVDTAFVIPPTFTVPGSGADTLESARGIALDSTYVYVVDAGPAPGEIASNEWFKFTRDGTPVKSSKSTDLTAHLDNDPDALVDDIVWAPHSSPVAPGLLLIALEHSGIQVIDTDGNFVDKFRWSAQSVPALTKPAAFAGLAIDPAAGNLYLADNDQSAAQIWSRLPDTGSCVYIVGTGDSQAYLQYPNPGCNSPLWRPLPAAQGGSPTGIFGIAYRPADASVYGFDFSSGDLWRFDPRTGRGTLVASTGIESFWGLAYDDERDVFYAGHEEAGGDRIYVVDPTGSTATPLANIAGYVNDIAFDSADKHIYGVYTQVCCQGGHGQLIRIDRDTGAGTVVGTTVSSRGLGYDPISGLLVGRDLGPGLYHIDPATAAADSFASVAGHESDGSNGWEGLAVVTVPGGVTAVQSGAPFVAWTLGVHPNPTLGQSTVSFALAQRSQVEIAVYDVAGRLVRRIASEPMEAGAHSLGWDGRDGQGHRVANGVYLLRARAGGRMAAGKIMVVR
jgi:hypothetical protein